MKDINSLLLVVFSFFLIGCSNGKKDDKSNADKTAIVGLWEVKKVMVGEESMTPMARWMRFNPDGSQNSGNGWQRHSVGTYIYNEDDATLEVTNLNGYEDIYEPLKVSFIGDEMHWTRNEDGNKVTVILVPVSDIPASPADSLLGVWQLVDVSLNGVSKKEDFIISDDRYTYFRWDKVFIDQLEEDNRMRGVYIPHAHMKNVDLRFENSAESYDYDFRSDTLILKKELNDIEFVKKYERIHEFPG